MPASPVPGVAISLHGLAVGYQRPLLPPLTARAYAGELVALVGRNGVGKSTLLRCMAGFQRPLGGHVELQGVRMDSLPVAQRAQWLTFVPSEPVRIPNLTVREFVAMSRFPYTGWGSPLRPIDWARVDQAMGRVGVEPLAGKHITAISDGERQRAGIAFALAQDTRVILMDEPTAFLDLPNKYEVVRLLSELAQAQSSAILYSTHDLHGALSEAHRVWMVQPEGLTTGLPEELALNNRFAGMLAGTRVAFDPHSGAFRNPRRGERPMGLSGSGVELYWTGRLLERLGYHPVAQAQPTLPRVECLGGGQWVVRIPPHGPQTLRTLEGVASALQAAGGVPREGPAESAHTRW